MRANISKYEWHSPPTLVETLKLLRTKKCKPFAGGTDLMVLFEAGKLPEGEYVNIAQHSELHGIRLSPSAVEIGALATYTDIRKSSALQKEFPMLCEAAKLTGAHAIQNRGTLGGNIANASPAADSPPALLCYDAEIEVRSLDGNRKIAYQSFHKDYKKMDLSPDEIITCIRIPRKKSPTHFRYHKVGTRMAQAISKVCFAGCLWMENGKVSNARIAFGSVAPTPIRCFEIERLLQGQALSASLVEKTLAQLKTQIHPIDDIRSNKEYRLKVAGNLLKHFLESVK